MRWACFAVEQWVGMKASAMAEWTAAPLADEKERPMDGCWAASRAGSTVVHWAERKVKHSDATMAADWVSSEAVNSVDVKADGWAGHWVCCWVDWWAAQSADRKAETREARKAERLALHSAVQTVAEKAWKKASRRAAEKGVKRELSLELHWVERMAGRKAGQLAAHWAAWTADSRDENSGSCAACDWGASWAEARALQTAERMAKLRVVQKAA